MCWMYPSSITCGSTTRRPTSMAKIGATTSMGSKTSATKPNAACAATTACPGPRSGGIPKQHFHLDIKARAWRFNNRPVSRLVDTLTAWWFKPPSCPYLCQPLFFYKGKSTNPPSQALTAVGIFEELATAHSTTDLLRLTGGRSVYSEMELAAWNASEMRPVKVINYLLAGYIMPAVSVVELLREGVFVGHPPQSIFEIRSDKLEILLPRLKLGFAM